ncbi:hypothetical protein MINT15_37550 [Saccharomonospora viridis]|uniref:Uncharacterized protein n=1 Tax=Saccharomonospora viridis TaxID=1852 RepID=A0A837D704_9PSEU|nr:hypothetical protein MINT15_37550 [Saccharomonospora viridis]
MDGFTERGLPVTRATPLLDLTRRAHPSDVQATSLPHSR